MRQYGGHLLAVWPTERIARTFFTSQLQNVYRFPAEINTGIMPMEEVIRYQLSVISCEL
jgi:hypothetical protein